MPRLARARTRHHDENLTSEDKKCKPAAKSKKPVRVPLADRTNSASDENTSIGDAGKKVVDGGKKAVDANATMRPRRALRAPAWLTDHQVFVPQRKDVTPKKAVQSDKEGSNFNTPCAVESIGTQHRPRRAQRLPSRFSDHSMSPSKFVPITPNFASTPLKTVPSNTRNKAVLSKSKQIKKSDTNNNPEDQKNKSTVKANATISNKVSPQIKEKLAVYEFTYDPSEEPEIPKKKIRKQMVRKRAAPRRVVVKDNYAKNVEKQLANLKSIISRKGAPQQDTSSTAKENPKINQFLPDLPVSKPVKEIAKNAPVSSVNIAQQTSKEAPPSHKPEQWDDHPLSYSPVTTPEHNPDRISTNKDPLNLLEQLSFFDEVPVASSSMISRKSVAASPWRVDLDVHYKYPINTFVKSNMTPAFESSFTNVEPTKPHKYSGIFAESGETGLKQTSILSFIKEKAQKSQKKSQSPVKINTVFDHSSVSNTVDTIETENDGATNKSNDSRHHKDTEVTPLENQSPFRHKEHGGVTEFFGFDDSGPAEDQENISPKNIKKGLPSKHILRNRNRAGLSELNQQKPMRLTTAPSKNFAPTSAIVNKLYEELKSAKDAPDDSDAEAVEANEEHKSTKTTIEKCVHNDDETEPHLFEDIEVVHHKKPERRSYGKTRKVTFQQSSLPSDASDLSEDDNDSIYTVTTARPKRKAKPKKNELTAKESEEAEQWAEKFNSMIEEVEEFPLVIE